MVSCAALPLSQAMVETLPRPTFLHYDSLNVKQYIVKNLITFRN